MLGIRVAFFFSFVLFISNFSPSIDNSMRFYIPLHLEALILLTHSCARAHPIPSFDPMIQLHLICLLYSFDCPYLLHYHYFPTFCLYVCVFSLSTSLAVVCARFFFPAQKFYCRCVLSSYPKDWLQSKSIVFALSAAICFNIFLRHTSA